ncbi:MAG: hypothetical protein Q9221_003303 [Calogaya cf. arnoldii]
MRNRGSGSQTCIVAASDPAESDGHARLGNKELLEDADAAEAVEDTNADKDADAAEAADDAEDTEAAEAANTAADTELADAAEDAGGSEAAITAEFTNLADAGEDTEAAEDTEATDATEAAEDTDAAKDAEAANPAEAAEDIDAAEDTDAAEDAKAAEDSEAADAADTAEGKVSEVGEGPDDDVGLGKTKMPEELLGDGTATLMTNEGLDEGLGTLGGAEAEASSAVLFGIFWEAMGGGLGLTSPDVLSVSFVGNEGDN